MGFCKATPIHKRGHNNGPINGGPTMTTKDRNHKAVEDVYGSSLASDDEAANQNNSLAL